MSTVNALTNVVNGLTNVAYALMSIVNGLMNAVNALMDIVNALMDIVNGLMSVFDVHNTTNAVIASTNRNFCLTYGMPQPSTHGGKNYMSIILPVFSGTCIRETNVKETRKASKKL